MRLRLTIFLIFANIALFFLIRWFERAPSVEPRSTDLVQFTTLEISGKNIDKPRVLKFENNRWRIVSPIDWSANLFAVNRIRNQIEFLDKEASFPLSELKARGYKLSEYGLDAPAYTIKYGNGKKMYTLKIGKSAPVGNRVYMLDEQASKIIVVDKEFVESFVIDTERLRNQNVFDIPRFEVSAFSVRLPSKESNGALKGNFRRVGLIRDGVDWKFETPIVAAADSNEVTAFLGEICGMAAKSFTGDNVADTGFELSALPTTLTIEGTNRKQVLLIGGKTKDGSRVYARLEDNPTVFTIDASILKMLSDIQTSLRDKSVARFDVSKVVSMDISKDGNALKFGKLKSGVWDVIGKGKNGATETYPADAATINKILLALKKSRVRSFVSDAAGENVERYGITADALHIVVTQSDGEKCGLTVGKSYLSDGARLTYIRVDGTNSVCGISDDISEMLGTNLLDYRSRILQSLPEKSMLTSVTLTDLSTGNVVFKISSKNGDFNDAMSKFDIRQRSAAKKLLDYARNFTVKRYTKNDSTNRGIVVGGKRIPWAYSLKADYEVQGTESTVSESFTCFLTKRLGGLTQYGGAEKSDSTFLLENQLIDSLFELSQNSIVENELKKSEVNPPKVDKK